MSSKPRELYMRAIGGEVTFHDERPKGNCITWVEKLAYDELLADAEKLVSSIKRVIAWESEEGPADWSDVHEALSAWKKKRGIK